MSPETESKFKVGVLMHASQEHMRQVALGVAHYTQVNPQWKVVGDGFYPLVPWNRLRYWSGDGLVAIVNSYEEAEKFSVLNVPVVLSGARIIDYRFSIVASNNFEI